MNSFDMHHGNMTMSSLLQTRRRMPVDDWRMSTLKTTVSWAHQPQLWPGMVLRNIGGRGSDTHSEIADPLSACYLHILTMTLLLHRRISQQQKATRSIIYAVLVGISFWLMLVFMTYNGFLMISVVIGAGLGHYAFGGSLPTDRGIQCHW